MLDIRQVYLLCIQCNEETIHKIIYIGGEMRRIKCKKCGITLEIDKNKLLKTYTSETVKQILKEPLRLNKLLKKGGKEYLFSIPGRLLSKPFRITKEVMKILEEEKED